LGWAIYNYPRETLTIDSGDVKADVLIVLGGGQDQRPQRAAKLFKQGAAPRILVTGYGDYDVNVEILKQNGVPANVITQESDSRSTYENAIFSIPILRQMGARRVIIVTSWFHSRRALTCFQHCAPDITFYSRPSYLGYQTSDFTHRQIIDYERSEYIKLLYYWVWHWVPPVVIHFS
jgi:uncharacterized SAM-binding protein YcdF (DUF218 family)